MSIFKRKKEKPVSKEMHITFVCADCGSDQIEALGWVDVNSRHAVETKDDNEMSGQWCRNCEEHVEFKEKD